MDTHWSIPSMGAARRSPPAMMAKRLIRRADDLFTWIGYKAHPSARRAVLFEVSNPVGFDAQLPVIRQLLARDNVSIEITSSRIAAPAVATLLSSNEVDPNLLVTPGQARHRRYAACVMTDISSLEIWRTTRRVLLHHGSTYGNSPGPYPFRLLRAGAAEYLLCLAPMEVTRCIECCGDAFRGHAVVTGQPKLDALVTGRYDRTAFLTGLDLDPGRKTVLLTSHWTPESLYRACDLGGLRDHFAASDVNLLVTGHYHLFDPENERFSGGIDWTARLRTMFDGTRMRVLPRPPDHRLLLWSADLLIGDHSSIHMEYATLFRPIVLYQSQGFALDDPDLGDALAASALLAPSPDAMPALIDRALAETTVDHDARRRLLDLAFAYLGRSGERAAEVLESLALHGVMH